jgi:Tfp pilus assembly protein PilN
MKALLKHKPQIKRFDAIILLMLVLFAVYISTIYLVHSYKIRLETLETRLEVMSSTINLMDGLKDKEEYLKEKLYSINELSKSQIKWHPIVESIITCIPDDIVLNSLNASQDDIILKCTAKNMASIIDCTSKLESCPHAESISDIEIYPNSKDETFEFTLYLKPYGYDKRGT